MLRDVELCAVADDDAVEKRSLRSVAIDSVLLDDGGGDSGGDTWPFNRGDAVAGDDLDKDASLGDDSSGENTMVFF